MADLLFLLPTGYLQHAVLPLLTLPQISSIDAAVVNRKHREVWLQLLCDCPIALPDYVTCMQDCCIPIIKWLVLRKIPYSVLRVDIRTTTAGLAFMLGTQETVTLDSLSIDRSTLSIAVLTRFLSRLHKTTQLRLYAPGSML